MSVLRTVPLLDVLRPACFLLSVTVASGSSAQAYDAPAAGGSTGRSTSITGGASLTETVTDNRNQNPAATRSSDVISQASASIHVDSRAGRVIGTLDYSLTGYVSARDTSTNRVQRVLNASGSGEVLERHLFIDASAAISQQPISAFGVQTADPALDNGNRSEVRTLRIAPRLRGRIGTTADAEASVSRTVVSNSAPDAVGSGATTQALLSVNSMPSGVRLGWNANASSIQRTYTTGRGTEESSATLGLVYQAQPDLSFSVNAGRESNDVISPVKETTTRWGVGTRWVPSDRTQLAANYDHRYFGGSHSVSFDYRLARSVLRFSSSRDVNTGASPNGSAAVTAFDLFYSLFSALEPDPAKRAALVNTYLAQNGISPTTVVSSGFQTASPTLISRNELSYAVQFIRSTAALSLVQSTTRRLGPALAVPDDFSRAGGAVEQRSVALNLGHRLTPQTGISMDLSRQWGQAPENPDLNTRLSSISLNVTSSFGPHTTGSVAVRHSDFDSPARPYKETALTATLGVRF